MYHQILVITRSSVNEGRFSNPLFQIMRFQNIQKLSSMPILVIINMKIEISNNQLGRRPGESAGHLMGFEIIQRIIKSNDE